MKLFSEYLLGKMHLKNRIVMCPMTRTRAIENIPNELMVEYYSQRASTGLIITEGTSPSPNGLGYLNIPGIYSSEQVEGWKLVTDAVHQKGGNIFVQLMHTGRVSHSDNMPEHSRILAPSAIQLSGEIHTRTMGSQPYDIPEAMSLTDIQIALEEYVLSAKNAIEAGFDGVEIHGANGYLVEQFISPLTNKRSDNYGGSVENRTRFVLELATKISDVIGKERTGIRLSPYGILNDMQPYDSVEDTYEYLAEKLDEAGIVYLHLVDHSTMGAPPVPQSVILKIETKFRKTIIASGGLSRETAENLLEKSSRHLAGFGRPIMANPDFALRLENDFPLNQLNMSTVYGSTKEGYTDYPFYAA